MKKIILIIVAAVPFAMLMVGCGDAAQNAEMMKNEMEKINTAVDEQLELLSDSLDAMCSSKVDSIALMRISEAAKKGTGKPASNTPPATTTSKTDNTTTQTPQQTKKDKMSGKDKTVTDQDTQDKKDKMSGKTKTVTPEDTDKKKSKMKGGGN